VVASFAVPGAGLSSMLSEGTGSIVCTTVPTLNAVCASEENDVQVARADAERLRDAVATVYALASADAALVVQLRTIWAQDVGATVLTGDTAIKDPTRIDAKLHTSQSSTQSLLMHKPVSATQLIDTVIAVKTQQRP
jgi:hypothetical protein